ncbi:hypothetical protein JKF63_06944 [Porcisia hertigi]|uniref:Uncharacterized protein n=1 Tax=Porcisia hertigi TaxID=2761500 RepID=A0A836YI93_9TRYP|nr:hypothetical protein JKF63_06944 [Porcisia hertigi]
MSDDVFRFFRTSRYRPEVLRRLVMDIETLCNSLCLSRKITTWGTTNQPKVCLYGGLPASFPMIPKRDAGEERSGTSEPVKQSFLLPIQVWISHQFPVEPPFIYLICTRISENSHIPEAINTSVVKIVSNHPNVDLTGLCFCKELAEWNPSISSLSSTVKALGKALERSGRCPMYIDEGISEVSLAADVRGGKSDGNGIRSEVLQNLCLVCYERKDTVLVPCGHFCVCMSCAANLIECPLCRSKIMVRQRVYE